jgi:UDP-N-acetylmuramoylalanine--D-glutamate ligase
MRDAAAAFTGVPHRLEVMGTAQGATWINDSIATAPERTMAGLRAFDEPIVLLLGGREKNLPLDELRRLVDERCRAVIFFGESGPVFASGLGRDASAVVDTMDEAVARAAEAVEAGDVVLLSPAGTSFDAYPSFEARGADFRALVAALPGFQQDGEA